MAHVRTHLPASAGVDAMIHVDLTPPFEFEEVVGDAVRYVLDCMPRLSRSGEFQACLVIRSAETGCVVAELQPAGGLFARAEDACRRARDLGRQWLQRQGAGRASRLA